MENGGSSRRFKFWEAGEMAGYEGYILWYTCYDIRKERGS